MCETRHEATYFNSFIHEQRIYIADINSAVNWSIKYLTVKLANHSTLGQRNKMKWRNVLKIVCFNNHIEGLEFIQQISKHLPKDLAGKTRSVTSSFQRLLHILDETKRICVPESNNNHIARRSISTGSSNEPIEQSYESKNLTADAVTNPMYIK